MKNSGQFASLVWLHYRLKRNFGLKFPEWGITQIPVSIAAFRGEDQSPQKIAAIVQADLERSGRIQRGGVRLWFG